MARHNPHNLFLLILLQSGFVGLGLFIYFLYTFFRLPVADKQLKELSILFMVIFIIGSFSNVLFFAQFTLMLFILFTGLFINTSIDDVQRKQ